MREIKLADKAGFCFGVKRAVDTAITSKEQSVNKNIYTFGPLIHNNDVVENLKENNIYSIELEEIENLTEGDTIIIRSHGIKPSIMNTLKKKKLNVIDATCPYVATIHRKVAKYYAEGYKIVIVGDKQHPEVIGINGWCNDEAIISKDGTELKGIKGKVCIVSQTTEKQSNWKKVLNVLVDNCKEFVAMNTICSATETRQKSAEELSKEVDLMIVIGGKNSSNTAKLYEICKKNCKNTYHIENSSEIPDELIKNKDLKKIGVTAGASTPNWIIEEAMKKMSNIDNNEVNMNEQLEFMEQNETEIYIGKIVKGEIVSLNEKEAFIDLNYKSDAVLPLDEVTTENNVTMNDLFKVGDIVEGKVIKVKNSDGNVVLSRIEVERAEAHKILKESFEDKKILTVKVKQEVKGGFICNFKGIKVFLPGSLVKFDNSEDVSNILNTEIEVRVIEFNKQKNNTKIVVSRRAILAEEKIKNQEIAWNNIKKGEVVEGIVRRINDFGAFVDVQGVDGLLHISEISWGKVESIKDELKIGEKIKVCVLEADKENKKLSLSIKKLSENPWNNIEEKYPVGSIVLGKVVRFSQFGAFVELEPGVDALLHISQISHDRVENLNDVLKINQSIKARIIEVQGEKRRISLSTKDLMDM